jgi:hypothetical protein
MSGNFTITVLSPLAFVGLFALYKSLISDKKSEACFSSSFVIEGEKNVKNER